MLESLWLAANFGGKGANCGRSYPELRERTTRAGRFKALRIGKRKLSEMQARQGRQVSVFIP